VEKRIRTQCSVEIDDVFVIQRLGRSIESWCPGCGQMSTHVTPEDAAILMGIGPRAIYRMVESGEIHCGEAHKDLLLVCLGSLLEKSKQTSCPDKGGSEI